MKCTLTATVGLLMCLSFVLPPFLHAQSQQPASATEPQESAPAEEVKQLPGEAIEKAAKEMARGAGTKIGTFAAHADHFFAELSSSRVKGWVLLAFLVSVGFLSLLYGWSLVQSFLIPCAPVLGLATGGITALCIIEAMYSDRPSWFKLTLLMAGIGLGVAAYLFSALRAKPVAAFLVVLSPFLIIAAFLFSHHTTFGIAVFCVGFFAGFAGMLELRPLAIISTSMLGATSLLGAWGMTSHLWALAFIRDSFQWLIQSPLLLLVAWAAVAFIGGNFQFTTGPRGTLDG